MRNALAGLMSALAIAGAAAAAPEMKDRPRRSTDLPRPVDGNIAIRQELEAARRAGTVEAYDLFIARHGDHPLARVARRERESLAEPPPKRRG